MGKPRTIDWAGIIGTAVKRGNPTTLSLNFICNGDKTRAFFVLGNDLSFAGGVYDFYFEWRSFNNYETFVGTSIGISNLTRHAQFYIAFGH